MWIVHQSFLCIPLVTQVIFCKKVLVLLVDLFITAEDKLVYNKREKRQISVSLLHNRRC